MGFVTLRIMLSEEDGNGAPMGAAVRQPGAAFRPPPAANERDLADENPLLLYLADEPEIGREFTYGGARWEIVDYQDGWVARLVVTP